MSAGTDTTANGVLRPGGAGTLAGRQVSRVGYGAMQLRRLAGDRASAVALLRRAAELGVDHIDTAEFYGDGVVNELISEAFGPKEIGSALRADGGVLVVSKVGATPAVGGRVPLRLAQRPEELRASVEDNLRSLGTDQVPVVNLRRTDSGPGLRASGDQVVDLDDQLAVLTALRDEGKIGAIGLSSVSAEILRRALPAAIVCVQNAYSLVARGDEDVLALCAAEGIAWVPYFPLGGAHPGVPKVADEPAVRAVAESLGCTPSQAGLAWLLRHSPSVLLIAGTANSAHLEANLEAGAVTLDDAALARLDAVTSRSAEVPLA
ncbi:MAG: aldo/keto reductase [Trebonia sp.]